MKVVDRMKLNNKGFMMAEVVVVSAVILITLTTLYMSYNKVLSFYKTRLTYNDVTTLYRLSYYADCFTDGFDSYGTLNGNTVNAFDYIDDGAYLCTLDTCNDNVYVVYNNGNKSFDKDSLNSFTINKTYKEYVDYLSDAVDFTNIDYVMVMEHCNDSDDCKYAYLELKED